MKKNIKNFRISDLADWRKIELLEYLSKQIKEKKVAFSSKKHTKLLNALAEVKKPYNKNNLDKIAPIVLILAQTVWDACWSRVDGTFYITEVTKDTVVGVKKGDQSE